MSSLKYIFIGILVSLLYACKENKYSGDVNSPVVTLEENEVHSAPNMDYTIKAHITDDTGLKSIQVESESMKLNELISFGRGLVTDFDFSYPIEIPKDVDISVEHPLQLLVTDVAGKTSVADMRFLLDKDIETPYFVEVPQSRLVLTKNSDTDFSLWILSFEMKDNNGLASLKIECDKIGLNSTIPLNGTEAVYEHQVNISEIGDYTFLFTLTDITGLVSTVSSQIRVVSKDRPVDLPSLYLTDVFTDKELNDDEFGVPVVMTKTKEYNFELIYYNRTDHSEILFITDPSKMAAKGFGVKSEGSLLPGDDASVLSLLALPEKGYYKICVDIEHLTYSIQKYTPSASIYDRLHVTGEKIKGRGDWNLEYDMKVENSENPYIVYDEFEAAEGANFKVSAEGWSPKWGPVPDNGDKVIFQRLTDTDQNYHTQSVGKYRFTFDYLTERAVLKRID